MKRNIIISIIILFSVTFSYSAVNRIDNSKNSDPDFLFNHAQELMEKGQFQKAIPFYSKVIALTNSQYEITFIRRGSAYQHIGDFKKALQDFNQAYKLSPDDEYGCALYNRGFVSFFLKNNSYAESSFRERFKLSDDSLATYNKI